jgi:hypothetical protein
MALGIYFAILAGLDAGLQVPMTTRVHNVIQG